MAFRRAYSSKVVSHSRWLVPVACLSVINHLDSPAGPAAVSSLTVLVHAAVTVEPSSVVSQKEEDTVTVTLPLAGVHVIVGEGRAAPLGLGSPGRDGHQPPLWTTRALGHWNNPRDHLLPVHLTLYHRSSLRRAKSGPKLNAGCFLISEETQRVSQRKAISHSCFSVAADVCAVTECLVAHVSRWLGHPSMPPSKLTGATLTTPPGHLLPSSPWQPVPLLTLAVTTTVVSRPVLDWIH